MHKAAKFNTIKFPNRERLKKTTSQTRSHFSHIKVNTSGMLFWRSGISQF